MELVEGDDLSQRTAKGAIPLDEALPIAKQIAEALEAAHDQGILHRDLNPANIKVRADGTVKVLDFGLARALSPAGSQDPAYENLTQSPTLTTPAHLRRGYGAAGTEAGMILGTAAHMSPEQAKGRTVDRRADIWAYGAVLFEMLTGTRARPDTGASRLRAANSMSALTWCGVTSNHSTISSMVAPASRFSKTMDTGMRVFLNTHAPLTFPGTLSTTGHWDQSS